MPLLLVATSGGHLLELSELAPRLDPPADDAVWVTFDTPQSRSLLDGKDVHYVPTVDSRDVVGALAGVREASKLLKSRRWDAVVSTGAAVAMSYFPVARMRNIPIHYIESAARTSARSVTGRMTALIPGSSLYTQHLQSADDRWHYRGSVFDSFEVTSSAEPRPVRRVLVTLGTSALGFERLVARLETIVPEDVEIIWQLGRKPRAVRRGRAVGVIPADDLAALHDSVDVVVAHAGVGSALTALGRGHAPVLVPRLHAFHEGVDNHQVVIARQLAAAGLAVEADASSLTMADLEAAAARSVGRPSAPPRFVLRAH